VTIRESEKKDKEGFLSLVEKLSRFNRDNHDIKCKGDNYDLVLKEIEGRAAERFEKAGESMRILVVEQEGILIGYALGEIFRENPASDNGTGEMGLLDELYLEEAARGKGLGQQLIDELMQWFESKEIKRVKLHAYTWNEQAAAVYEKNGFKPYAVSYEKFLKTVMI